MMLRMGQTDNTVCIASAVQILSDGIESSDLVIGYGNELAVMLNTHGYVSITSKDAMMMLVSSRHLYEMVSRFNAALSIVGLSKREKVAIAQAMVAGQYGYTGRVALKAYTSIPKYVWVVTSKIEIAAAFAIFILNMRAINIALNNKIKELEDEE